MKFTVTTGNPTPEELLALQAVLANHKSVEITAVIKRSAFGLAQLRQAMPGQITFGARKQK